MLDVLVKLAVICRVLLKSQVSFGHRVLQDSSHDGSLDLCSMLFMHVPHATSVASLRSEGCCMQYISEYTALKLCVDQLVCDLATSLATNHRLQLVYAQSTLAALKLAMTSSDDTINNLVAV